MVFRLSKGIELLHAGAFRGQDVIPYVIALALTSAVTNCLAPSAAFAEQDMTRDAWGWLAARAALLTSHGLVIYLAAKRAFRINESRGSDQFLVRFVVIWFFVSVRLLAVSFVYGFLMNIIWRSLMQTVAFMSPSRLDTLAATWATWQMLENWILPLLIMLLWYWLMIKSFQRLAEMG